MQCNQAVHRLTGCASFGIQADSVGGVARPVCLPVWRRYCAAFPLCRGYFAWRPARAWLVAGSTVGRGDPDGGHDGAFIEEPAGWPRPALERGWIRSGYGGLRFVPVYLVVMRVARVDRCV